MEDIQKLRDIISNEELIEKNKSEDKQQEVEVLDNVKKEISSQYEKNKSELSENEDFKKLTKEIINRSAQANLKNDMLQILTQEQQNELQIYLLENEKSKLSFRKKKEKKIIIEEVKAEISNRKIEALRKRYGYLYGKDEDFVPSKIHNKIKEVVNWWNGTSNNFKKFIKGTLKFCFYGAIAFLIIFLGYRGIKWIVENTQNLPNI